MGIDALASGFSIVVDDEIALVLAEPRLAEAVWDVISRNRARLARWEPWAEPEQSVENTRTWLEHLVGEFATGVRLPTYLVDRSSGAILGSAGARIDRYHSSAEIGYWIDGAYEVRGLARRGVGALVDLLIARGGLHRLEAKTGAANRRSRALLERLHFTLEGVSVEALQVQGQWQDIARYGRVIA